MSHNHIETDLSGIFRSKRLLFIKTALPGILAAIGVTFHAVAQDETEIEDKKSDWTGSAALGAVVTSGNSDTVLFNARISGDKKWLRNELHLSADGTYGENDGAKNNEQVKGAAQYNRIFGEQDRWYLYGRAEALHDGIADIDGRFTFGPGVGYYFVKNDKWLLSGETGPGIVIEKSGGSDWESYFTMRVAERLEYKINDRAKLWQSLELIPDVTDLDNYIVNAEAGIETSITESWALRLTLSDTYDSAPASGREENDFKLVAGISYKF